MSYSRFGCDGSDVYVYLDTGGYLTCCGCPMQKRQWVDDPTRPLIGGYFKDVPPIIQTRFPTTADLLAHLERHRAAGHCVPDGTLDDLRRDAAENDAWIPLTDDGNLEAAA